MTVELRCERRLWRALSFFGTTRTRSSSSERRTPARRSGVMQILLATIVVGLVLVPISLVVAEISTRPGGARTLGLIVATIVAVLLAAVTALAAHALGTSWWYYGAGEPVLTVTGGVARGRLRPAVRGPVPFTGWDFEVPMSEVTGVRLTDRGVLVLDLPPNVADTVRRRPETAAFAQHWQPHVGSPTAWPAARMLRRSAREERLAQLVAELSAQRPPVLPQ